MKNIANIFVRLIVLVCLVGAGLVGFQVLSAKSPSSPISSVTDKVKGISTSMNLSPAVNGFIDMAARKLTDSQPIVQPSSASVMVPQVKGDATSAVSDQVRSVAQNAANQIMDQIKDIPKKEAARVTRQMCDQIVSELEK